jgi:Protein of unknown function (DUF4239)
VSLLLACAIIVAAVAAAVALMLLVRRFAPAGGFFTDSDRAAGVFGVTGTGFAVLLAFVIFLSFSSYDRAREKASLEAVAVSQLYRTAKVFSQEAQRQLHGELICYARAVVDDEWVTMRDRRASPVVDGWLSQIEQTIDGIRLQRDNERVAYEHWFDQMAERREGRRGRLTEAEPLVPPLVWLALILGGALVVAYMCFYADPREPAVVQAMMIGVGAVEEADDDHPRDHHRRDRESVSGSIEPTAITMTLQRMEAEGSASRIGAAGLCDERGQA